MELAQFFNGKRVLVTGHTGFKGAWLCWMLRECGAEVFGYALPPEDIRGNLFLASGLKNEMSSFEGDLLDADLLSRVFQKSQPEFVFHLAAQPIVLRSYSDPIETFRTNVLGTAHLLEAARATASVRTIVVATTDKVYENREWSWAYRETDPLGGHDPYSASKAMAELVTNSYRKSFLEGAGIGVATARAGNVIGGGDYSADRIIPDIVDAIRQDRDVVIRNPQSVRPWQHVLDALIGYLLLAQHLQADPGRHGTPYNFAPMDVNGHMTVEAVARTFILAIGKGNYKIQANGAARAHEATMLRLDPSLAMTSLGWRPVMDVRAAVDATAAWYKAELNGESVKKITKKAIRSHLFGS